jgi:hypothetical protein
MQREIRSILLTILALSPWSCFSEPASPAPPAPPAGTEAQRYPTPDDAAKALLDAARSGNPNQVATLFGSRGAELFSSGDEVADKNNRETFAAMAQEKMSVEKTGEDRVAVHVGKTDWSFPIPLVKDGDGWRFDAEQGREEIINRRIGRNELSALGVINGYLEAQFEYANADRDGDGIAEYAQKLRSEPGQFDGLFWEAAADRPESPLGPLVADARAEGYQIKATGDQPAPYHGYYYRILTRQGPEAPGGKYDYIINGNMIAGFGLVAFPADYGSSGVMTFIVNHQGRIYQKDLGPKTREIATAMKEFNPGPGWEPVGTGG